MRKFTSLTKSLLVAAALLVGGASHAWADVVETTVVNCNFEGGETLFSATNDPGGATRLTVSNAGEESAHYVNFANGSNASNGNAIATYNFSALTSDASAVDIEFDAYLSSGSPNYHHIFTIGDASTRAHTKQNVNNTGAIFTFGMRRGKWNGAGSNVNYWSINNEYTTNSEANFGKWLHVKVYVDLVNKKVTYSIKNQAQTETINSDTEIAFLDEAATACTQIDYNSCLNNGSARVDNLVIKKYKDNSAVATTYTVRYQNASGTDLKDAAVYDTYVGNTYTASSADMATFYSDDTNMKYIYNSGNTSATATSTAASNVITLIFDEYAKVDYTITAKNGEETLGTLASGSAYTDGSTTEHWSKYQNYDSQWYSTNVYAKTITEAGNTDVEFTSDDIAYFFEMENLTRSGGAYVTEESTSYSNSYRLRLSRGSLYYTPALTGGTYLISIPWENINNNAGEVYVYTRSSGGDLSEKLATFIAPKGSGTFTATITVPDGYSIAFNGNEGGSYNNNARMDYMTLKSVSTVSVTVSDASYATYVPTCDLDFFATSIEAYKVKVNEKGKATLTKVDNVPAGTPVLLYKDGGATENIPVMTGAAAVTDNDLVAGTGAAVATTDGEYTNMILNNVGGNIGFYFAAGQTVAANRAYLHFATSLAPDAASSRMVMVFGEETTGISDTTRLNNKEEITNIYNLSGQRVAQPTKGLYIVNGKKVIIK